MIIIGGAGFIGSAFVREVNKRGIKPIVVDLLTYAGRKENLIGTEHEFIRADVRSEEIHDIVKNSDIVVNFAAETHVDRSIYRPQDFVTTNVLGVVNLLEAARKYDFKYVHISTDEVYGEECADEDSPLQPSSPYSASKASADLFVKAYVRTYGIKAIIVRPSNNYGPRQFPEKLIPKVIIRTFLNMHVPIYGDGRAERDWIYVEDTVRIIYDIMERSEWRGEVYNIPGGQRYSVLDVIKIIGEIMGKEVKVKFVDDRPGHDKRYCMTTKLKYEVTPLKEGLRKTVEWYLNNRWWWEDLIKDKFFTEDEPWKK
ncbi:dTDP-glucose 4,6-dehydratase [Saccharolobus solfataricus]|uniref:dTDP-Glucose 4,6-dehydratase (RfbB-3) n=3 Tax=Saccharolobus solfataricus TaxID=2287 RepID=Q97XG1_SACS2|nr:dTDP-glucose 4,6-dehydratase [Saccharolobus solfataricus]AAK41973.1 dTDP-Glucose 4,6-dehydratase (rfbB-3) [Saccharolobus solfataricus P2]AKA74658.1 dTDP-glucose 4,6-dehydratase [Saccharolobus solfataricus]AKA77352.1 dTDP-glucose 4,6-dehydratase [Saccharolobus solfataricus]AKA80043.1 dTDP-glucose 4,6-dehydratase [Saccharolobus solfataricus]AZF69122.1 dTDP-glucose 4,6-dehydratase [Saccharolobus solfataricus]